MAAVEFMKSPIKNNCFKYINVKLLLTSDLLQQDSFMLQYIKSKLSFADPFTKALTKYGVLKFIRIIFQYNESNSLFIEYLSFPESDFSI